MLNGELGAAHDMFHTEEENLWGLQYILIQGSLAHNSGFFA